MAKRLVKVTITYCAECGYEPQTLALAEALMKQFRDELTEIELIPWHEGSFDVTVDGELVHSMFREGGFATHEKVFEAVRRHQEDPAAIGVPKAGG
ncbi:MAG TPA: Rdx family protein [Ktedonobacterales bacterium]|nr:Rdx family protein [Ktedonobacterales bacterium]